MSVYARSETARRHRNADKTALIIGAGIGGLAAGCSLKRAGWRVRIFEQAHEAHDSGFGLGLAPNAIAALEELGIAGPVLAGAARLTTVELCRTSGRRLRLFDVPFGAPAAVTLRANLHRALHNAVGAEAIISGVRALAFADDGDQVSVRFTDGSTAHGTCIVGADGIHSTIRRQLHRGEAQPVPSGFAAVRGVVATGHQPAGEPSGVVYLGDAVEAAMFSASARHVYWYLSVLANDVKEPTPQSVLETHAKQFDPRFRHVVDATTPEDMRFDPLVQRASLHEWGRGRVTLLGDAAHPVMPHTGQGAALALEDAVALGLALSGADDVSAGLRRYEAVRMRRKRPFVTLGPRIARVTTTRNVAIKTARTLAIRAFPLSLAKRLARGVGGDPHRPLRQTPQGLTRDE